MTDFMQTPVRECRVGVAGCGAMGFPMLKSIVDAGFNATGFDVRSPDQYFGYEQYMSEDVDNFAASSDILISVVRDKSQTEDLCFTAQKVFSRDHYPQILILSSTLSTNQFHDIARLVPNDVLVVDAPMSGAPIAAINATLTFMVGAEVEQFAYLLPLFQTMGKQITRVGLAGSGMAVKVMNNYVAACSVVAVRRVLGTVNHLGLDREMILDVMRASSGATWFGDNFDAIEWSHQGFDNGNTIAILEKDVSCALETLQLEDDHSDDFSAALLQEIRSLQPFDLK